MLEVLGNGLIAAFVTTGILTGVGIICHDKNMTHALAALGLFLIPAVTVLVLVMSVTTRWLI